MLFCPVPLGFSPRLLVPLPLQLLTPSPIGCPSATPSAVGRGVPFAPRYVVGVVLVECGEGVRIALKGQKSPRRRTKPRPVVYSPIDIIKCVK